MFEQSEAHAFLDLVNASSPEQRHRYGLEGITIGGVAVLSRPGPDMSFWCQAVGFETPPTADLIGEIIEHYRARGVAQARLIIPPQARTDEWAPIADKYGLTEGGGSLKLAVHAPFEVPADPPGLRTALVTPDEAEQWSAVMWGVFGMSTPANIDLTAAALSQPHFRAYACWDRDEIVATGLVRLHPEAAHLFSGATVPAHRGRGAQAAIIAARMAAAQEAGCPVIVVETGTAPDGYNVSARNLIRAGFVPQYERQTWLWTA
ncbi:GNAT family N-acetyltransferase [Actinoplanes sp. NPDC051470]|uniref:GNAT family N-acetyltransferase n=1 Tax=Actinoplanes sp. NPDC051470 TaxID=3157224 RepID=UPI003434F9C8